MTPSKKETPAAERRRQRAEIAEWMADYERTHARLLPEYEEARREWEAADAERIAASKELHRHDTILVRAFSDPAPFDWEGKLALHGYDREAHEAAWRCASSAEERSEKARERMIAIGNQIHFPAARAEMLWSSIGKSHREAEIRTARVLAKASPRARPHAATPHIEALFRENDQRRKAGTKPRTNGQILREAKRLSRVSDLSIETVKRVRRRMLGAAKK